MIKETSPQCTRGWEGRCPNAKSKRCTCQCGGRNHGKNRGKNQTPLATGDWGQVFSYLGFGLHPSRCGLKIVREGDRVTVTLTELPDNPGTSVTNCVEEIATQVYHTFLKGTPIDKIRWIEHYPPRGEWEETFDEVTFDWDGETFSHPRWRRLLHREMSWKDIGAHTTRR